MRFKPDMAWVEMKNDTLMVKRNEKTATKVI
jgi:hypothetical protein